MLLYVAPGVFHCKTDFDLPNLLLSSVDADRHLQRCSMDQLHTTPKNEMLRQEAKELHEIQPIFYPQQTAKRKIRWSTSHVYSQNRAAGFRRAYLGYLVVHANGKWNWKLPSTQTDRQANSSSHSENSLHDGKPVSAILGAIQKMTRWVLAVPLQTRTFKPLLHQTQIHWTIGVVHWNEPIWFSRIGHCCWFSRIPCEALLKSGLGRWSTFKV